MNSKKILIVDDVEFSLEQLKSLMMRTNCEIMTAGNGQEALDIIKTYHPDLVLMDLFMPVMNGDECCKLVKQDPSIKKTPIILFTSSRKDEDRNKCIAAGCDDFEVKPILKVEPFFDKIKKFVDLAVREHIRIPIDAEVHYFFNGKEYTSHVRDISEGGVFISGETSLSTGDKIDIIFTIPNTGRLIEAEGKVARIIRRNPAFPDTVPGIGIQFRHVTLEGRRAVAEYVKGSIKA